MPFRKRAKRRHSRRFFWLATAIVLAILAYSGAWFYAAGELETRAAGVIGDLNRDQRRANCEEPTAHGYPFRIGLFCRSVFFEDAEEGVSVSAGAFRSAAQIYQPLRTVGELDGPARIALPFLPALKAEWQLLRMSARLTSDLPQRVSSEAEKVSVSFEEPEGAPVFSADALQAHTRRNGPDIEVALIANRLTVDPAVADGVAVPPLDGELLVRITDGVALLADRNPQLRGREGVIQNLTVKSSGGNAAMTVRGPVGIGADGRIDAQLEVTLSEPETIARLAGEALPERREQIASVTAGLSALGPTPTFPVNIRKGKVFVGFVPLGEIPPVE